MLWVKLPIYQQKYILKKWKEGDKEEGQYVRVEHSKVCSPKKGLGSNKIKLPLDIL